MEHTAERGNMKTVVHWDGQREGWAEQYRQWSVKSNVKFVKRHDISSDVQAPQLMK